MKNKNLRFLLLLAITSCSHTPVGRDIAGSHRYRPPARSWEDVGLLNSGADDNKVAEIPSDKEFHTVVIGSGLAGLSSAVFLTDAGKKVLLIEKEAHLGGLAAWTTGEDGTHYDRGAAYWTDAYEEEMKILERIGLGNYVKKHRIPDPIDSYMVGGQYYPDIWEDETLAKEPASFALFKYYLERSNEIGQIPNQPFEETKDMTLDRIDTRTWIESMPALLKAFLDKGQMPEGLSDKDATHWPATLQKGKRVLERFNADRKAGGKLKGKTGMEDVVELMDLYCRSALGDVSKTVSAMAFANFYISEIVPRYTTTEGTGAAALKMVNILDKLGPNLFQKALSVSDTQIIPGSNAVTVNFKDSKGESHTVTAHYVVFAAQLNKASQMIQGFQGPQADLMNALGYAHYSVQTVTVPNQHPYRAAYDTWIHDDEHPNDPNQEFTDVILGHWVDQEMLGYEGYRNFDTTPPLANGVFTIYHPISQQWMKTYPYNDVEAKKIAWADRQRLEKLLKPLEAKGLWKGSLDEAYIDASPWPYSVHIATPGHYEFKAKVLRQSFGRVHFANNNLGTPAFEEALFRGHCAAVNILRAEDTSYKGEEWTQCPKDNPDQDAIDAWSQFSKKKK